MLRLALFWAVFAACATFTTVTAQQGECTSTASPVIPWLPTVYLYNNTDNVTITPGEPVATPGQPFTLNCSSPFASNDTVFVWLRNASTQLCSPNCTTMSDTNVTGKTLHGSYTDCDYTDYGFSINFRLFFFFTCAQQALLGDDAFILSVFVNMSLDGVLTLENVNATEHGGVYDCVALMTDRGNFATSVTLRVKPVIVEHPEDRQTSAGENFTLSCRAESFPYPEYKWQKYNTTSQSYDTLSGENSNVLEFNQVQFSQYGVYRCVATAPMINNSVAYSNNATVTGECIR